MSKNQDVRSYLPSLPNDIVGVDQVLKDWQRQAEEALEAYTADSEDPQAAYALLASWAGQQRFRRDLVSSSDLTKFVATIEELVNRAGKGLVEQALEVPNPEAWKAQAQPLEDSAFLEDWDSFDRARLAADLLGDLDEAELVLFAARRLNKPDEKLEAELADCVAFVTGSPDLFVPAGTYARIVEQSFREDMDPELALTTDKHFVVVDAVAELFESLELNGQEALEGSAILQCLQEVKGQAGAITFLSVQPFRPRLALAASSGEDLGVCKESVYDVHGRGLRIHVIGLNSDEIALEVYDERGNPSADLDGTKIFSRSGAELARITDQGARFSPDEESVFALESKEGKGLRLRARREDL